VARKRHEDLAYSQSFAKPEQKFSASHSRSFVSFAGPNLGCGGAALGNPRLLEFLFFRVTNRQILPSTSLNSQK